MDTTTTIEYSATIGTVDKDTKVHLAHGTRTQKILCRFGSKARATAVTIATLPENGDVCDTLLACEIKMSRLCKNCFSIDIRARYSATIKAAIAALPADEN